MTHEKPVRLGDLDRTVFTLCGLDEQGQRAVGLYLDFRRELEVVLRPLPLSQMEESGTEVAAETFPAAPSEIPGPAVLVDKAGKGSKGGKAEIVPAEPKCVAELRLYLEQSGISQKQASQEMDIRYQGLNYILAGKRRCSPHLQQRIEKWLASRKAGVATNCLSGADKEMILKGVEAYRKAPGQGYESLAQGTGLTTDELMKLCGRERVKDALWIKLHGFLLKKGLCKALKEAGK